MRAPFPPDEVDRLEALRQYEVLDTGPEQEFDDLTHLAAQICGTPISAITLVDQERQWFKSRVGLTLAETPRDVSFCAHAILGNELLLVSDTSADERFADNPFVTLEPHIRFYAGVPLITPEGQAVGTLCVIDTVPRQLDQSQQDALRRLARQAVALLEARPETVTGKGQSRQARLRAERQRLTRAAEAARQDAENLKASEERYRRLFEAAQDGVLILDATSGQIEDANPFLCQLLGYTATEFLGKQLWELGIFRDIAANQDAFRALQEKEYICYEDLPLKTKAGQSISVEFVSNVYVAGNKKVIQCNIRDVSERKIAEEKRRQNEANLAKAQQIAHLGSWELDLSNLNRINENSLTWSDEIFRIFGYEPGEIEVSNENFFRAVHPEDRERVMAVMVEAIHSGNPYSIEHRIILPDGQERSVHSQAEIIYSESGQPLRVVGTGQDITERKQAQAMLQQSESRFRTAISEAPVPIMIHREDGKVLQISKGWTEYSGYDLEDVPTIQDWAERAYGENSREAHQYIRSLYRMEETRSEGEWTIMAKNGQNRIWDFVTTPLGTFGDNQRVVISTASDITESKQAKEALEARTREIVTIWESMTDAFFSLDTQWRFTHVNQQTAHLWQKNATELIGKNIWEEFPAAVDSKFYTEYTRAANEQLVVNFEAYYPPDNAWREVHVYPSPFGLSVYFRDITDRKRAEEQLHFQKTLLEAQTEASLDGILVVANRAGEKKILSYNQRLVQMWGIPLDIVASGSDDALRETILSQVVNREGVSKRAAYIYDRPAEQTREEVALLDGRIFDRYSTPITDANGSYFGRVWFFRDITEAKQAEALLVESQQRLALASESAHIGIWDWDVVANRLVWDAQMFALYGVHEQDFSGAYEAWTDGLHPDDRVEAEADINAALDGVRDFHPQFRVVWPNGEVRHIEAHALVQKADDGSPLRMIGVNWDITERKQNEEALRIGQERFEILSHATNDAVWDWNLLTDDLWWNQGFHTLFGYNREILEPGIESWKTRIHPDELERVSSGIHAVIESGQQFWSDEYRFRRFDDSYATIFDRGFIIKDENDVAIRMVGSMQDISERKQAENALRESEARSSAVIHNALDCIITIDHENRVIEFNPAAEKTFGYTRAEALGQDLNSLIIPPAFRGAHTRGIAHYLKTGVGPRLNRRAEVPAVCKDGTKLIVELAATVIAHSDPPLFTAYLRDITEQKQAENALRESEERFQSIVANVPGMVYQLVIHPDGSLEWPFVSEGFREIYEVGPEILQSEPAWSLDKIHPDDRSEFDRSVTTSAKTLSPWSWEGRQLVASGKTKWIQAAARPQRLPDGSIWWNGLVLDITARKEAEEQRDRFFTMSLDMLGILGLDGNFIRVNPAFVETLGYSEAELMAHPFKDRVHPEDRIATELARQNLIQGIPIADLVNRYLAKDGSWRWLEWRSIAVPEQGVIYAAARDVTERKEAEATLLRMRDELEERVEERTAELGQANSALHIQIAEREEAEAQTRARARQQEAVAELGRRALMDTDIDTLLHGATALVTATLNVEISSILELMPDSNTLRFCATTGWKTQVIGQIASGVSSSQAGYALLHKTPTIVSDLRTETRFIPSQLLLEQGIISGITVVIGGQDHPFGTLGAHTTQQRQFTQDDVNFLQAMSNVLAAALEQRRTSEKLRIENIERQMAMGVLQEVTEGLKQAKEEAEAAKENAEVANRAKSEFLSRMSHELRTPLNAILGFGQILNKEALSPLSKESIGYILKGGRHLLDLINEVLDIARVESGRLELSLEPVALDDVIPEVCALVQPLAAERSIQLEENTATLGNNYILADRQRLKQVLLNLLSNAIKYNRQGGQVEISCQQRPDGWATIAVRDTGQGISPQNLQKLFTPFERLGASTSEIEGSGLGLVLSQRLVTAMGGTLSVKSVLGQGTIFTVELVETDSPEEQLAKLPQGIQQLNTSHENQLSFSVLCIEDNPGHIRLLEVIFQGRPEVTLLTAMEGNVGLELARQHEPDLILLDLNLPDMHGKEVLARLQQSAITRDIPVVVISADATPNQVERLLNAGAKACLTKPLDVDQFLYTLDQFLKQTAAVATQLPDNHKAV